MYKVFINGKAIIFTEHIDALPHAAIITCSAEVSSKYIIEKVLSSNHDKSFYVKCTNVEEAFNNFSSQLRVIEAAGGIVFNERNEILAIFRRGKWDLPKGKIDNGENVEDTAIREVDEETGVGKCEILRQLQTTYHAFLLKDGWRLKKTTWFEMKSESEKPLVPQTEEDITDLKWMTQDELKKAMKNTYPLIMELLSEYLKA